MLLPLRINPQLWMRSLRDEMSGGQPGNVGPYALLALALIAVSSAGAVLQQMEGIPPLLKASWRMYGTSLVLVPGFLYQLNAIDRASISMNDCYLILLSALFLALHFGSWIWSLDHTSLVHSLLFVTSHPLVVVAIMPIIGSQVSKKHVLGASVGFLGAAIALLEVDENSEVTLIGDAAAFFGAVTVVGYLMIGRHLRSERNTPVFVYAFPVTLIAGLFLTLGSITLEGTELYSSVPEASAIGWVDLLWLPWVAYLSLGPGLCGHTVINTVLRWISPLVVSVALLFEPVIGGAIGWIITGDAYLGTWTIIGGPLMVFGAILVTLEEGKGDSESDTHS